MRCGRQNAASGESEGFGCMWHQLAGTNTKKYKSFVNLAPWPTHGRVVAGGFVIYGVYRLVCQRALQFPSRYAVVMVRDNVRMLYDVAR